MSFLNKEITFVAYFYKLLQGCDLLYPSGLMFKESNKTVISASQILFLKNV